MSYVYHLTKWLIASMFIGVPLVYAPTLKDYALGPKLFYWQMIMAGVLLLWFFTKKQTIHVPKLMLPALAYTGIALFSIPIATHPDVALLEASKVLSGFICFFILANFLTPSHLSYVLKASAVAGAFIALLGMCDYFGWRPISIPSAGLPSATLGFRNIAAMYLIQTLPFVFALFLLAKNRYAITCYTLAFTLMGAFLIYTRTRGAWLGLSMALIIAAVLIYTRHLPFIDLLKNTKRWQYLICAGSICILLAAMPSGLQKMGPQSIDEKKNTIGQTIQSLAQAGGDRGRLTVWKNTLPLIAHHPITGVGLGNWSVHYPRFDHGQIVTFHAAPERPHNTLLSIWSEMGSVGLLVFIWFCIATIRLGMHHLSTPHRQWVALAALTSFFAIIVHGLFSFPHERITPILFFWFVPGLFAALSPSQKGVSPIFGKSIIGVLLLSMTLLLTLTWRLIQFESSLFQAVQSERATNWSAVVQQTKKALDYGAFHSEVFILHGYALNTIGNYDTALSFYQKALQKRPNDIQLLNGLAIAAQNQKQFELAHQTYLKALQLVDSADTRYNLAGLLLQNGHAQQAATQYEQVLLSEDPSLDLYYHLSLAYFLAQSPQKAQTILKRAFELMPTQAQVHFQWIEELYRRHRTPALARVYYTTFIKLWPGDSQDHTQAHKRLNELNQTKP